MAPTGSLLDLPLDQWTYELIHQFLDDRVPESDRVEYKQEIPGDLQDTLVAMANGDGGYVFIGVAEVRGRNIPHTWPHLEPGKNHVATVFNKAGSETSPPVRPQARVFTDPDSGKEMVVIKIESGPAPPYFAKNRGVFVRVGERNTLADPRSLEALFARRRDVQTVRQSHREAFSARVTERSPYVTLHIYLAPLYAEVRLRYDEVPAGRLRQIVEEHVKGATGQEERYDEAVHFSKPGGNPLITFLRPGQVHLIRTFPDVSGPAPLVPILDLFLTIRSALSLAEHAYPLLADYEGELFAGLCVQNIANRAFAWPTQDSDTPPQTDRRSTGSVSQWRFDDLAYRIGDDPLLYARRATKSLCWRAGYEDYEEYIDRWGRSVERR